MSIAAYTAGLLDGEGSIQINPSKGSSGKRYWTLGVQISSNCHEVLQRLRDYWDVGSITSWKSKKSPSGKTSYNWRIYSDKAERLLTEIHSWLIIKREHADIALLFRDCVASNRGGLTTEMSKRRTELALRLRELNTRYGKVGLRSSVEGVL